MISADELMIVVLFGDMAGAVEISLLYDVSTDSRKSSVIFPLTLWNHHSADSTESSYENDQSTDRQFPQTPIRGWCHRQRWGSDPQYYLEILLEHRFTELIIDFTHFVQRHFVPRLFIIQHIISSITPPK